MTRIQFFKELKEFLQCEADLTIDTCLWDSEEWDSMAIMSCIAYFDANFGVKTKFNQYKDVSTVEDLMVLSKAVFED